MPIERIPDPPGFVADVERQSMPQGVVFRSSREATSMHITLESPHRMYG